jgi:hypothetical protein
MENNQSQSHLKNNYIHVQQFDEWTLREIQLAEKFTIYTKQFKKNKMNQKEGIYAGGQQREREVIPQGTYVATCYSVIEIGTVASMFEGEEKRMKKVRVTFELPALMRVFDPIKGEQPMVISNDYTLSMADNANLRKFISGMIGREIIGKEAYDFDIRNLIGMSCLLNVVHKQVGDKTYANIHAASPLIMGMVAPAQINPSQCLMFFNFDFDVYNKLPKFLQEKIAATPEWNALQDYLAYKSKEEAAVSDIRNKDVSIAASEPAQPTQIEEDDLPF